jgi:dihydrofolate reductase
MKLSHIVAVAENGVIGSNNDLPWDIPEDMAFFKEKTKGRMLIMGRKTFESVGHPLPKRLNIVVTRNTHYEHPAENVEVVQSVKEGIEYCTHRQQDYGEEIFIIGGGEIFKETMPLVDTIYITKIHKPFDGDIHYPKIDLNQFKLVESRDRTEPVPFTFETYVRK